MTEQNMPVNEIQEELNKCLADGTLIESVKNTIVGITNMNGTEHVDAMAEYCFQGIDAIEASHLAAIAELEAKHRDELVGVLDEVSEKLSFIDGYICKEAFKTINSIKQRIEDK
jgi:hypothetical protein